MLIIQHIWSRWTKASRGTNARLERPRLHEAYELPEWNEPAEILVHERFAVEEREGFMVDQRVGPVTRDDWARPKLWCATPRDWRVRKDKVEIRLSHPSEQRLQTRWPAFLPSPLFALRPGDIARIDWNGRFRMSMSGSNRSTYYEQHIYWLTFVATVEPRLFLDATPRKHVDLRTEIY
jgi:hypothetical protein